MSALWRESARHKGLCETEGARGVWVRGRIGSPDLTTLMGTNRNKICFLSVNSAECDIKLSRPVSSSPGPSVQKAESVPATMSFVEGGFSSAV